MTTKGVTKAIDRHIQTAHDLALQEVERLARHILRRHTSMKAFVMAMGDAFFTPKKGFHLGLDERRYFKPLMELIERYDDILGITGNSMYIDGPDAPIVTEW